VVKGAKKVEKEVFLISKPYEYERLINFGSL
jgi:hypothetical protein